jgi:hypothetical protein
MSHKHFWRVRHRAGTVILFHCNGCPQLLPVLKEQT